MNTLENLSVAQLKKAVSLREKIETLTREFNALVGGAAVAPAKSGKRTMSAAGRARIAAAQKARWAKAKGGKAPAAKPAKNRKLSAEGRAAIIAAAKARRAKARQAKG
jgi:hypothetical protein